MCHQSFHHGETAESGIKIGRFFRPPFGDLEDESKIYAMGGFVIRRPESTRNWVIKSTVDPRDPFESFINPKSAREHDFAIYVVQFAAVFGAFALYYTINAYSRAATPSPRIALVSAKNVPGSPVAVPAAIPDHLSVRTSAKDPFSPQRP